MTAAFPTLASSFTSSFASSTSPELYGLSSSCCSLGGVNQQPGASFWGPRATNRAAVAVSYGSISQRVMVPSSPLYMSLSAGGASGRRRRRPKASGGGAFCGVEDSGSGPMMSMIEMGGGRHPVTGTAVAAAASGAEGAG
ncbi:unnamed protein product, partial [Discosporangium mesarthrocarpum]